MGSLVKNILNKFFPVPGLPCHPFSPSFIEDESNMPPEQGESGRGRRGKPVRKPFSRKLFFHFICVFLFLSLFPAGSCLAGLFDWQARGWVEGSLYLPRGEYCPSGGITYDKQVEARYGLDLNFEFGPRDIDRLFFFATPSLYFGDNLPGEDDYNFRANPMVLNAVYGVGLVLSKKYNIQARVTHGEWFDLGGYEGEQKLWNAIQLRWLFDHEWISGWTEGSFYPSHNEYGPNAGVPFDQQSVARYGLELDLEIHPAIFRGFFLFSDAAAYFGDSRPQHDYNYKTDPIAMNIKAGLGYRIRRYPDLQIRLTHGEWVDLGKYEGQKFDWDALQIRWSFDRSGW